MKHITLRTHEVQNIIAGRQTRLSRPVKPQPEVFESIAIDCGSPSGFSAVSDIYGERHLAHMLGKPGDILWAQEGWRYLAGFAEKPDHRIMTPADFAYKADEDWNGPWKTPVTMPLSACRLFLRIKEIRVERIQDITEEGAKAEGVEMNRDGSWHDYLEPKRLWQDCAKASFQSLHQSINGPESWDLNLWHWIIIVEKTDKP